MNSFWSAFLANLASLPGNIRSGLRPGVGPGSDVLSKRMRRSFLFHLHPVHVTKRALNPMVTLGLGVITLTLFLVLGVTGILLMIYYVPTTKDALSSTQDIQYAVTFGAFIRSLHRFASHAMVVTAFCHLIRIGCQGAYFKRELNWVIGLGLFLLTLGFAFTGYLLPWDQLSFWAVSVSANLLDHTPFVGEALKKLLLGGEHVGQASLIRFYTLHVAFLPSAMGGLVLLHLWRIRKDGGLAYDPKEQAKLPTVPAWPHLLLREANLIIGVLLLLFLAAALVSAPLGGAPDIHNPSNPEKTPWYFLWLQEMVSYSASVGGFLFPGFLLLSLFLFPFLERNSKEVGKWFGTPGERFGVIISLALGIFVFVWVESTCQMQSVVSWLASMPPWVSDFVNPAAGMLVLSIVVFLVVGIRVRSTRAAFLAGFAVLLVAILGFTLVGWCRGPGWVFYWPFEEWPLVY